MKIDRLDHNGRGITFIDNKITFVSNALPGEDVDIKLITNKKKYCEAEVLKINNNSEYRQVPKCKYYDLCGGCDIMHINYKNQLEFKKNKLIDILKKFADIDCKVNFIESEKIYNYRDKITLKVKGNKIGYYKKKSNEIIEIDNCLIVDIIINEKINLLKKVKDFKSCYEIVIRNVNSNKTAITFYLHNKNDIIDFKDDDSIITYIYQNKVSYTNTNSNIIAKLGSFEFIVSPQSFFQINLEQIQKILFNIKQYLKTKEGNLLDLYCGTGSIGIYLSDIFNEVYGIEICEPAIEDAKLNAKLNNVNNIFFYCGDTEKIIKKVNKKFDTLIVDPPRAGLTISVIEDIFNINPTNLIYISCDPITLSRDLKNIKEKYNIVDITGYDMFPNTNHIETVCVLERK